MEISILYRFNMELYVQDNKERPSSYPSDCVTLSLRGSSLTTEAISKHDDQKELATLPLVLKPGSPARADARVGQGTGARNDVVGYDTGF